VAVVTSGDLPIIISKPEISISGPESIFELD
jgi:hypothetical protein